MYLLAGLIIRDIVAGQYDPVELAKHRDARCKNSVEVICSALAGNYKPEHLFSLTQAVELVDIYEEKITACDQVIESKLKHLSELVEPAEKPLTPRKSREHSANAPKFDVRSSLFRFPGIDLTQIHGIGSSLALKLVAECGTDMSRWTKSKHFTSWL